MQIAKHSQLLVLIIVTSLWLDSALADEAQPEHLQHGAQLLAPYKQQLQQALQSGMPDGPLATIAICRSKAPAIANELNVGGIRMGRSSHKLRNPDNAPKPWVQAIIADYLAHPEARMPVATRLADGRAGYAEPIVTQPMCLTCHGENLDPAVQAQLDAQYPDDQATGFAVGDLRGIFWVEFPAN